MNLSKRISAKVGAPILSELPIFFFSLLFSLASGSAFAQAIAVLPVNIRMDQGQSAAVLTIVNRADAAASYQVRGFSWSQPGGVDTTSPTDGLMMSPPLGTIAPGATQVVRLVLRNPAQSQEDTYRVFVDQIPPPAAANTVRIALRLSIPVFAEPQTRIAPRVKWHVEPGPQYSYLVAVNDGTRHETVHRLSLTQSNGAAVKIEGGASPYILSGATRRWRILLANPAPGTTFHLSMEGEVESLDEQIPLSANS